MYSNIDKNICFTYDLPCVLKGIMPFSLPQMYHVLYMASVISMSFFTDLLHVGMHSEDTNKSIYCSALHQQCKTTPFKTNVTFWGKI